MKKFNFIFCGLLVAFVVIKVSFVSTASGFQPPVLPTNTSSVADFLVSTALTELASNGVRVPDSSALGKLNEIVNGRSILDGFTTSDYLDLATTSWNASGNFYDSNGNIVLQEDCYLAFYESDVGNAVGVYSKITGEPLLIGDTFENSESTINVISSSMSTRMPLQKQVLTEIPENNGVFVNATISDDLKDKLQSYAFSGYARANWGQFICFVPNGATADTRIIPYNNKYTMNFVGNVPDGRYFIVFTNNPNDVVFVKTGSSPRYNYLKSAKNNYGGHSYNYAPAWHNATNPFYDGYEIYYHAPTNAEYNSIINNDVVYTQPVTNTNEIKNNYYNYTIYNSNTPTYSRTVNNNYDVSQPISPDNYPYNQTVNLSDYSPTYNYYNDYLEYINSPQMGEDIGDIPDTNISSNIPILSNLEKRFPFSIPFDIYNLLQSLNEERVTPFIDETIVIPVVDYEWHIQYDLSDFDDVASLFRTLFLISFIIGLAYFSYDHFFGS